jgi:hypothetical protein
LRFEPDGVGEFFGFFENSRRFATRRDDLIFDDLLFRAVVDGRDFSSARFDQIAD